MRYADIIQLKKTAALYKCAFEIEPSEKLPETITLPFRQYMDELSAHRQEGRAWADENRAYNGWVGTAVGGAAGLLAGILLGATRKDQRLHNAIKYGLIGGGGGAIAGNMLGRAYGSIS